MIYNFIEKGIELVILFRGEIMLPFLQKHLRLEHSHGRHKILFIARLLPFRFRFRENDTSSSHGMPWRTLPLTFTFIITSSILCHSYETICNFIQRYNVFVFMVREFIPISS